MKKKLKKEEKCVCCKRHKKYDSNGLCSVCNYNKMLGVDIFTARFKVA